MIKFVVFSMILAIAMARPDGNDNLFTNPLQGLQSIGSLMNNKCFAGLFNLDTSKLSVSNLVRLLGCLLDQILNLLKDALGGAGGPGELLIKLLTNLRTVLMGTLNSVADTVDGAVGGSSGNQMQGIGDIIGGLTKALPGLKNN